MPERKNAKKIVNAVTGIIICEIVCVILLASIVFVTKTFFKDTFLELKSYYDKTFRLDTDIYEVLGENDEI